MFSELADEPEVMAERLQSLKAVDGTSAPGNKSLQLSEFVGEVLSFEKDESRFAVLKKRVHECKARNVTVQCGDFLDADGRGN